MAIRSLFWIRGCIRGSNSRPTVSVLPKSARIANSMKTPAVLKPATTTKVVVATTVALAFISFWRAAAVVLNDMASTMYYIGGITEQAVGKPAPWMVMAVMLFSFAVRSV